MKFQTSYDLHETSRIREKVDGRSVAEPDQSMTIQELLYRHARGLSLSAMKIPVYNEGKDIDADLSGMDHVDIQEAVNRQRERVQLLKEEAGKAVKERGEAAKKQRAKIIQEAIAFEMKQRKDVYDELHKEFSKGASSKDDAL